MKAMRTIFKIGQSVILGSSFTRKYAIDCVIIDVNYSHIINQNIYTLKDAQGNIYAGVEGDIVAD